MCVISRPDQTSHPEVCLPLWLTSWHEQSFRCELHSVTDHSSRNQHTNTHIHTHTHTHEHTIIRGWRGTWVTSAEPLLLTGAEVNTHTHTHTVHTHIHTRCSRWRSTEVSADKQWEVTPDVFVARLPPSYCHCGNLL